MIVVSDGPNPRGRLFARQFAERVDVEEMMDVDGGGPKPRERLLGGQ